MPTFIQTINIDSNNNHLHFYNIDTANLLAYIYNKNIMEEPSSFVYNAKTKRVELHAEFDFHPDNSKIILQQINWFLELEELYDNKDAFLFPYLENFKNITLKESNKNLVKTIFYNLNFDGYLGEISATFLKDKINELLID